MALASTPANLVPPDEYAITRRIEALEAQQRENLPAVMAAIAPMFADINGALETLATQQAALVAQQAQIVELFNTSVTFLADFNDNSGPLSITTSETQQATYSFTVPAGFSRALVVGYGSIGVVNPTATASSIGGRIYIDRPGSTVWGPQRFQQALAGADAAAYPYKQTVITGLSGGESVTLRLVALNSGSTGWGSTSGGASLNVQAYFART